MRHRLWAFCRSHANIHFIVLTWLLLSAAAAAQYQHQLSLSLVKQFLVLRNNYTDDHLTYDSQGKLTSPGSPGFGPIEGRIFVDGIQLQPGKLLIAGNRPVDVYYESKNQLQATNVKRKVTIEVALPSDEGLDKAIPELLEKVFYTPAELDQMKCSPDELKSFTDLLQKSLNVDLTSVRKKNQPTPKAQSLDKLPRACYPIGDRAYSVGKGVDPPKAIKAPDPSFSNEALRAHKTGTVVLMCIIDTDGRPTSFIVARPVGYGLDEAALNAVRTWTFTPGTFQFKPVPVAITVEVNFAFGP